MDEQAERDGLRAVIVGLLGTPLGKLGAIGGALASIFAGVAGFTPAVEAWDSAGLPTLAMRGFVRSETNQIKQTQALTTRQILDVQVDIATGNRNQMQNARDQLELLIAKEPDPETKIKMQQQMRRMDETIADLNDKIRSLRSARGPN